jgi:hypothetical protein
MVMKHACNSAHTVGFGVCRLGDIFTFVYPPEELFKGLLGQPGQYKHQQKGGELYIAEHLREMPVLGFRLLLLARGKYTSPLTPMYLS